MDDSGILEIESETVFVLNANGRIVHENEPKPSPGPRLWLSGCAAGNFWRLHEDVSAATAREIGALLADEPPLVSFGQAPRHVDRYRQLLGAGKQTSGLNYALPHDLATPANADLVRSGTPAGNALLEELGANGIPAGVRDLGFADNVSDIWPPWCIARQDGKIAALAFAARLGAAGATTGVATVKSFRGRGHAAAATAGWTSHCELASRSLTYSTTVDNFSSQRVTQRLGLRLIGASLRLI